MSSFALAFERAGARPKNVGRGFFNAGMKALHLHRWNVTPDVRKSLPPPARKLVAQIVPPMLYRAGDLRLFCQRTSRCSVKEVITARFEG